MINIQGLKKSFNNNLVLDDINLEIKEKDIFGLLGVSGAGKSTLLRCMNGLEGFQEGSLSVDGVDINALSDNELREFRKEIGMIFQHFSLLERENVYENVALPMKCWGYSKKEIDQKVKELLELVELSDKIHAKPRELSGGQKQRVAIARALTLNPKLLLCDEATSALDPKITNSILQLLRRINQQLGVTIVVVTHQMEVVKEVCNNMAVLSQGKIEAQGKVEDIFLDKPPVFEDLIGRPDFNIDTPDGMNIEIVFRENAQRETLMSDLAISTEVDFSIVWGTFDKFRDTVLGSLIINVDPSDEDTILTYLKANNIEWRFV